jgi:hypothetical protein
VRTFQVYQAATGTAKRQFPCLTLGVDEKDFKKHLRDLVHGHHHPEEHDWSAETKIRVSGKSAAKPSKASSTRRKKK